jgi:hypothetical protein
VGSSFVIGTTETNQAEVVLALVFRGVTTVLRPGYLEQITQSDSFGAEERLRSRIQIVLTFKNLSEK